MRNILSLFIFSFCLSAGAAPYPLTGSAGTLNPQKGYFFTPKGFQLNAANTQWLPQNHQMSEGVIKLSPSAKSQASLTVRTDRLQKGISLELYSRRWMRDYPNYGFEVLSAKNIKINKSPALVVDMLSREKNRQIRQIILHNKEQVAILTCQDQRSHFAESVSACNKIAETFHWIQE